MSPWSIEVVKPSDTLKSDDNRSCQAYQRPYDCRRLLSVLTHC